jgi:outer membrane protein TolC
MRARLPVAIRTALATALLAACDLAPHYDPPSTVTPADYKEGGDWAKAEPKDGLPRGRWWALYHNAQLDALEKQVAAANQDLKAAAARFDEARADARSAQADYYPTLDASSSASRDHVSRRVGNPLQHGTYNNFSLGLDLGYEIDVLGAGQEPGQGRS